MKLKQQPEDFQVEELTDVVPTAGPFAFYRLTKSGWTTPDALAAVRRRWQVDLRRLSYGGLKDRHARTTQFFTILRGPKRKLTHHDIDVEYLGQLPEAYASEHIRANRFRITLRALAAADIPGLETALEEVRRDGLPNYFDDQRFGSVSAGGTFMARELVLGRHEEALKVALTAPYEYDRGEQKKEKALLRERWGDWQTLREQLPRGHARSLVDYLSTHPTDFTGAVVRLRPELRGLYLSAYQSHLWNRMLALWLLDRCRCAGWLGLPLKLETVPVPRGPDEASRRGLTGLQLPLPSGRTTLPDEDPRRPYVERVLAEEGVTAEQMKLKSHRELFFSKGERAAWLAPRGLVVTVSDDERHPKRRKAELGFELPRGSYATLIVKRVTAAVPWAGSASGADGAGISGPVVE